MKRLVFVLAAVAAWMLAGCSELEEPVRQLQGSWRPVYAVGGHDDAVYHVSYDGALDETGRIVGTAVARENPAVQYDMPILFAGRKFFHEKGEDFVQSFFLDASLSGTGDIQPLHYYIEGNKLFSELPNGTFVNCDPAYLHSGSGKYDDGQELVIIDRNTIRIGGVTYNRMR